MAKVYPNRPKNLWDSAAVAASGASAVICLGGRKSVGLCVNTNGITTLQMELSSDSKTWVKGASFSAIIGDNYFTTDVPAGLMRLISSSAATITATCFAK